jgi:hypothetical protein
MYHNLEHTLFEWYNLSMKSHLRVCTYVCLVIVGRCPTRCTNGARAKAIGSVHTFGVWGTRERENKRTRERDHETTRQRDNERTRERDIETTRQRENETSRQRDNETTRQRENETSRQRENEGTREQGNQSIVFHECLHLCVHTSGGSVCYPMRIVYLSCCQH